MFIFIIVFFSVLIQNWLNKIGSKKNNDYKIYNCSSFSPKKLKIHFPGWIDIFVLWDWVKCCVSFLQGHHDHSLRAIHLLRGPVRGGEGHVLHGQWPALHNEVDRWGRYTFCPFPSICNSSFLLCCKRRPLRDSPGFCEKCHHPEHLFFSVHNSFNLRSFLCNCVRNVHWTQGCRWIFSILKSRLRWPLKVHSSSEIFPLNMTV